MYRLEDFTKNIVSFLDNQSLDIFIKELAKVKNCQEKFQNLVNSNPVWLESALSTKDADGLHIYFFTDIKKIPKKVERSNELSLCNFHLGTQPTLKVIVYKH